MRTELHPLAGPTPISRWQVLLAIVILASPSTSASRGAGASDAEPPYNVLGDKVGELTDTSALIHTRLTEKPTRNNRGYFFPIYAHSLTREELRAIRLPADLTIADLEGACPGKAGQARLLYGTNGSLEGCQRTDWLPAEPTNDFACKFALTELRPDTPYFYAVEMRTSAATRIRRGAIGRFHTAPSANRWRPIRFAVTTCSDYACRDLMDGYKTFRSIKKLAPDFMVHTGDCVYYDIDPPFATSVELARFHWHRLYSEPVMVDCFRTVPCYWEKDDHDVFEDDCWPTRPTQRVNPMTYADLAPVFRQEVPVGGQPYRKFRWGKGLEIWLTEARDFRSPNSDPDGPNKTLWGKKQKEWLKRTLLASDADFRVLISPDCIVGPGGEPERAHFELPEGGADSHGDGGFAYEGREFRHWVRDHGLTNLIVINGDRHWQYHSVDPETGLQEFACGAVADLHSVKTAPLGVGYYRFRRLGGGFISASLGGSAERPRLTIRHHNPVGEVVNEVILAK
jgi:alkaline phosphatase D